MTRYTFDYGADIDEEPFLEPVRATGVGESFVPLLLCHIWSSNHQGQLAVYSTTCRLKLWLSRNT